MVYRIGLDLCTDCRSDLLKLLSGLRLLAEGDAEEGQEHRERRGLLTCGQLLVELLVQAPHETAVELLLDHGRQEREGLDGQ